jgi:hypothetical protein
MGDPIVVTRRLSELPDFYDWEAAVGSPSNIWPEDRSWFVYTDSDLHGTRVSGPAELIASLAADNALETSPS